MESDQQSSAVQSYQATFITGNANKLKEFNAIMESLGLKFDNKALNLPEF